MFAHQPAQQPRAAGRPGPAGFHVGERHDVSLTVIDRGKEDVQPPAHACFAAGRGVAPPVIVDGIHRREIGGPVVVEFVAFANADQGAQHAPQWLGRPAVDHAHGGLRGLKADRDFLHALEIVAEDRVRRRRVLDLAEIIHDQFQRRLGAMTKDADGKIASEVKRGKRRGCMFGFDPDRALAFQCIVSVHAGPELGGTGTFAAALAVEAPAMITAAQALADNGPPAQAHTPMRTFIRQGRDAVQ